MGRHRRLALSTLIAAAAASAAWPAAEARAAPAVPGELIVRFTTGAGAEERAAARRDADVRVVRSLPVSGLQLVAAEPGQSAGRAAAELERDDEVLYAEPNFYRSLSRIPDDTHFPLLWGLSNTGQMVNGFAGVADADIDAPEAWERTTGSAAVTAAVVDSGVDVTHGDLTSGIWTNPGELGAGREANGLDDDANGLVDDWRGWDWVTDDNLPSDGNGHGTHVSGTIAARGNNALGVTGVGWSTSVMALRVLDAAGSGTVSDLISAYRYAAVKGARIVNASLGGGSFSQAELDAINAAPSTLFVVAAGNGGSDGVGDNVDAAPEYPCAYAAANVICVAATDQSDALASFSNYGGTSVDLAAPGVRIASTYAGGGYVYLSGTSMATPHVAGAAALVWALHPTASAADVKTALLGGVDAKPSLTGRVATGGRLNADRALATFPPASTPDAPAPSPGPAPPPSGPDVPRRAPEAPGASPLPSAAPPATRSPAPPADRSAPRIALHTLSRRSLRGVIAAGYRVRARCSENCVATMRLILDGRTARRLGVSRRGHPVTVGRARSRLGTTGRTVTVTLSRRARARLRGLRGVRLALGVAAVDSAGNERRVLLRISLRR